MSAAENGAAANEAQAPSGLSRSPGRPKLRQILSKSTMRNEFHGVAKHPPILMAGQLRRDQDESFADIMDELSASFATGRGKQHGNSERREVLQRARLEQRPHTPDKPAGENLSEILDQLSTSFAIGKAQQRKQAEQDKLLQREQRPPRTPERPSWAYDKPKHVFTADIGKLDWSVKGPVFSLSMELQAAEDGWQDSRTNERGRERDEFGTKTRDRMGPTELKFAKRLDDALAASRILEQEDLHRRTSRNGKTWSTLPSSASEQTIHQRSSRRSLGSSQPSQLLRSSLEQASTATLRVESS